MKKKILLLCLMAGLILGSGLVVEFNFHRINRI